MRKNLQTGRPVVRSTSADAYRKIRDEGLLSERRWQVYDALFAHGPCTGMELLEAMPTEPEKKHCDRVKFSYCRGKGYVEQGRLFGKEPA